MSLNIKEDEADKHWPKTFAIILRDAWKWRNGSAYDRFGFHRPHDKAGFLDGKFTEILKAVSFDDE